MALGFHRGMQAMTASAGAVLLVAFLLTPAAESPPVVLGASAEAEATSTTVRMGGCAWVDDSVDPPMEVSVLLPLGERCPEPAADGVASLGGCTWVDIGTEGVMAGMSMLVEVPLGQPCPDRSELCPVKYPAFAERSGPCVEAVVEFAN